MVSKKTRLQPIVIVSGLLAAVLLALAIWMINVSEPPPKTFSGLEYTTSPNLNDRGSSKALSEAITASLTYLDRVEPTASLEFGDFVSTNQQLRTSLRDFQKNLEELGLGPNLFKYLNENYDFFHTGPAWKLLVTGYFEPKLVGSRTATDKFRYPIYARPNDLCTVQLAKFPFLKEVGVKSIVARCVEGQVVPYFDRAQIDFENALADNGEPLFFVDDLIDLFFLHIQGSGAISLPNNQEARVHYSGKNGHPYRAIGRLLLQEGKLTRAEISMQSIKRYLRRHPEEIERILTYNPSYIFFEEVADGPQGALGVKLTPRRSVALDHSLFPKGAIGYLVTSEPVVDSAGRLINWKPWSGFVLVQDTGGAITGPSRLDLFTGSDTIAELYAGHLRHPGEFYLLQRKAN